MMRGRLLLISAILFLSACGGDKQPPASAVRGSDKQPTAFPKVRNSYPILYEIRYFSSRDRTLVMNDAIRKQFMAALKQSTVTVKSAVKGGPPLCWIRFGGVDYIKPTYGPSIYRRQFDEYGTAEFVFCEHPYFRKFDPLDQAFGESDGDATNPEVQKLLKALETLD